MVHRDFEIKTTAVLCAAVVKIKKKSETKIRRFPFYFERIFRVVLSFIFCSRQPVVGQVARQLDQGGKYDSTLFEVKVEWMLSLLNKCFFALGITKNQFLSKHSQFQTYQRSLAKSLNRQPKNLLKIVFSLKRNSRFCNISILLIMLVRFRYDDYPRKLREL